MLSVYISSTYLDLRKERKAASDATLTLRHHPIKMEDYTSTEEKPLDVVRNDIRGCDLFIGIYGLRYGYIPPGEQKSITHLEYEAAGDAGKPRLLFIRDDAQWLLNNLDQDQTKINAFRSAVLERHTISKFKTVEELKSKVLASLSRFGAGDGSPQGQPSMQPLVPYLCDRSEQELELEEAFDVHHAKSSNKPFVCVIHGDVKECHDKFAERLRERILPRCLRRSPDAPSIKHYEVEWPHAEAKTAKRLRILQANLGKKLCGTTRATDEQLPAAVVRQNVPVIISVNLYWQSWSDSELELIRSWLRFWKNWPASGEAQQLFILLCVQYRTCDANWPFEQAGETALARSEKIKNDLNSILFSRYDLSGVTLELPSVLLGHVDAWAKEYKQELNCRPEEVMQHATRFFERLPAQPGRIPSVPMERLAPLLMKWAANAPH